MQKRSELTRLRKWTRRRYSKPVARIRGGVMYLNRAAEAIIKRYAILWKSKVDGKLYVEFTDDYSDDYAYSVMKAPRDFRISCALLRGMDGRYHLKYNESISYTSLCPLRKEVNNLG